nr:MAG TPA: Head Tail Connector Protein [Caudoviricetes sp.]
MAIDTDNFVDKNLQAFKDRMRITSGDEDERLRRMLASSIVATTSLVGATKLDEMLTELTFERARYVYHDALDEFQKNYADEIELQTFLNSLKEE